MEPLSLSIKNFDKNGGILITKNDFEEQDASLLCYAGVYGSTSGNSVKFTEVMLVEGFLPAPVWTPSFSEQQAEIKTITETLTEIRAENGEISLKVSEVSTRVETAKQEAINTAAADATSKANAAKDEAKNYTDSVTDSMWKGWIDASKLDESKYYPVVMQIKRLRRARIELNVALNSGTKPSWSTHDLGFTVRCIWESSADEWGTASINRIIEDYHYRYSNVIPAGDVGQMTHSSREYIYVRGGGKYYFVATNTGTPFLVTSDYTASNQTISVKTSVTTPVLTNVMKTEFDSQITQLKDSINLRVTKTDYDKNNQDLNQSIGNLQTSYNSISGTVSSLNTRLQTVEKAGYITTSQGNTLYASKKLENGNELISYINQDATNTTIKAKNINLNGAISANGNVQITTDGKLIAVNGQFTGKITATEGEIAGLKLSNNGLRSSDFNASSKIGSCYAKNGFSVYASGSGVLKPSTGGMQAGIITAVGDFISHITGLEIIAKETSYNSGSSSKVTALRIQAENRYYGTPFDPPLAIEVVSGDVLFGGKMTVNNTSIFRGQIYLNLNNIPNISGASNYYLCINRSTGQLSYR